MRLQQIEKLKQQSIKQELNQIDFNLFKNKEIVQESVFHLLKSRQEIDDFIDNLELLSDNEFKNDLKKALEETKSGDVISGSIDDLKKSLKCENNYTKLFLKKMKKLDKNTCNRILNAIENILIEPYRGSQLVFSKEKCYKWRVGDYRIIYKTEENPHKIIYKMRI